ncbi:Gag protein [Phytophthora palmivora]|uniref:Gag protein n=1 Tax=Phytophthora palmivora TaxID=4796 RepID=A0A2P4XSQ6_9STRA|nr:Gag protein [Phytophthora palmivora]
MDLDVKFEDFDNTDSYHVLDMDKYDLILDMARLEKHESWIDWCGKSIGARRPAVSTRALTGTPVKVAKTLAPSQLVTRPRLIADRVGLTRRQVPTLKVVTLDVTDQAVETAEKSANGVSSVGSIVGDIGPQGDNVVPQTAEAVEESAEDVSGVRNVVPRKVQDTEKKSESAAGVSSVELVIRSRDSCQVKAGSVHLETLTEVSALLNLEELSMKDFLAELKAGEIAPEARDLS